MAAGVTARITAGIAALATSAAALHSGTQSRQKAGLLAAGIAAGIAALARIAAAVTRIAARGLATGVVTAAATTVADIARMAVAIEHATQQRGRMSVLATSDEEDAGRGQHGDNKTKLHGEASFSEEKRNKPVNLRTPRRLHGTIST